jgi:hypothetical protein
MVGGWICVAAICCVVCDIDLVVELTLVTLEWTFWRVLETFRRVEVKVEAVVLLTVFGIVFAITDVTV